MTPEDNAHILACFNKLRPQIEAVGKAYVGNAIFIKIPFMGHSNCCNYFCWAVYDKPFGNVTEIWAYQKGCAINVPFV